MFLLLYFHWKLTPKTMQRTLSIPYNVINYKAIATYYSIMEYGDTYLMGRKWEYLRF